DATRSPRPARIRRDFGVAELDLHVYRIDAQAFTGDLRQRRLEPLADALDTDSQIETSVRRDARESLLVERAPLAVGGGAVRGLLGEAGDAGADQTAIRLAFLLPGPDRGKADGLDRLAQQLRIVAAVEVLVRDVVERHLLGTDEIGETHLVGFPTDLPSDRV